MMANKSGYSGKFVKLAEDIVLNESGSTARRWNPIGEYFVSRPFEGTFDGDGHTISGVYVNYSYIGAGFFGYSKGTIKNVGIIECNIKSSNKYVGSVCGMNYVGTITNCYSTGTVTGTQYIGGVCGYNNSGALSYCYNTGAVSGTANFGGVIGLNSSGTVSNCCYNSDFAPADNSTGVTGLNTLQMTCADALDIMGFDKTLWVKKANDKENNLAFYPSFSEEAATSVGYTTKLDIALTEGENPVFGEELKLDISALVKFDGMTDFAASDEAYAGEGSFKIKCGDGYLTTTAFDLPDNTVVDYTYIKGDINAGTYTFTLEYDGTGSDYLVSDTATLSVTIDKADYTEDIDTIEYSHAWNTEGSFTASEVFGVLPEDYSKITNAQSGITGDAAILTGAAYEGGKFSYTLAENTRNDIGKAATITYTISTTNYNDIIVTVKVTVTDKQEQTEKPECVLTIAIAAVNSYTAAITPVEGAEYSFDGTTWSSENTLT